MFAALLGGFAALLVGFFYDFILGKLHEFSYMLFENIYENVSSEFVNFFWGNQIIEKQLKLLNEKLKEASGLRNDAEGRQLDEPNVKEWLDELKDVIYRAQDLMDEIDYEAQRSKHEPESESNTSFLNKMKSKFDKTIQGYFYKLKTVFEKLFLFGN